jgi:hypothetical protein
MNTKAIVPASICFVVAAVIVGIGLWAKSQAPEDANPSTAVMVPGIAAALLVILGAASLVLASASRNIIAVASLVSLVFCGAAAGRIYPAMKARESYVAAKEQWDTAVREKKRADKKENMISFLKVTGDAEGNGLTHDTQYFLNALYASAVAGLVGCLLLAATKPKPE